MRPGSEGQASFAEIDRLTQRVAELEHDLWEQAHIVAELRAERDRLANDKANLIQQAQQQAQEARTQQATLLDICRAAGVPMHDWQAASTVPAAIESLRARVASIRASTIEECAQIAEKSTATHIVDAYQHPDRCLSTGGGVFIHDAIRALAAATPPQGENEVGPTAHDHGGSEPSALSDGGTNPPSPGGSV